MKNPTPDPRSLIPAFLFLAGLAACWVIPARLGLGAQGSYYTFGYVGDEYCYAVHIQPLITGTTAGNPINGLGDPALISPFYLNDACRAAINCLGLHVVTFFWLWRVLFPVGLAGLLLWLARECLPWRRKPWAPLARYAAAAAFPLLYCLYDLVTDYPPLQGWLNRVPTNIEYPLSLLLACLTLRFLQAASAWRGVALALAAAATVYLRPYTALPWALLLGFTLPFLIIVGAVRLRSGVVALAAFLGALLPWLLVEHWNSGEPVYHEMQRRFWGSYLSAGVVRVGEPYGIAPFWPLYSLLALVFVGASRLVVRPWRELLAASGLTMAGLIFLPGLLPFSHELRAYDRMGCFYLVVLLLAGLLGLGRWSLRWRGQAGRRSAGRMIGLLAGLALCAACVLGVRNFSYAFAQYPQSSYPHVLAELPFLEAYKWIERETPPDALFLVDDGIDWQAEEVRNTPEPWRYVMCDDLFQVVARRRRVYDLRLYGRGLSDVDWQALKLLHFGTFGAPETAVDLPRYQLIFNHFAPQYVFWRKTAPIPRAYGGNLKNFSRVVHDDPCCQIWRLR